MTHQSVTYNLEMREKRRLSGPRKPDSWWIIKLRKVFSCVVRLGKSQRLLDRDRCLEERRLGPDSLDEATSGWFPIRVVAIVVLTVEKGGHFHRRMLSALFRNMRVRSLLFRSRPRERNGTCVSCVFSGKTNKRKKRLQRECKKK